MALTRLDNLYSSKTGKYLYVSPDDFNASDNLDNRGNSPLRPFKTIQRAFIEVARYSYVPGAGKVDRFDQFSIMLMPGNHYIDNRPGLIDNTTTPEFDFSQVTNEWTDTSKLNLKDSDNVLYKFNATTGGAIVPRGCSLVGYDLRRTVIRPLYVPNPADKNVGRTSIFNLTGGCYLWQFTIKDGDLLDTSPLYNSAEGIGKVYSQPDGTGLVVPEYSHHKICIMEYAENKELDLYYEKVGKAFSKFQPTIDDVGELDALVQENRIVGPLSDSRSIDSLKIEDVGASRAKITITTKIEHGYFENQYVAVLNTALDDELNGTFNISLAGVTDPKVFTYYIDKVSAAVGLTSGNTYNSTTVPNALGANAIALAEIDSVESASPYVFNCSIRSTWGQCGMWANGAKATGFRSMVVAQYTGVSLQKDDRAFIRYDRFTNTWNEASLTDAFATVPYHTKGDAYWKDDWRNFHIRASDDAFIQCVSVFAVGFFDHFLMESGGDMSITNSNSNFGNTSLHAIGHKGFAFNQDKGGYITDIIPPKILNDSRATAEKVQYYVLGIPDSNDASNHTRLYLGSANENAEKRPAATIGGFRIGSKRYEKLYAKLDPAVPAGPSEFSATLSPSGFKTYSTALSTLNPVTIGNFIDNKAQDSANQINDNREFIQNEAYEYIINKYTYLDPTDPSFTGTIEIGKCKRDIGLIVDSVVKDLRLTLDTSAIPGDYTATSNINVIQAAESYFIGGSLDYIDSEKTETLESFDYVKNLCIAAMRNWDYLIGPVGGGVGCVITGGSSVIDVGDTAGLIVGMSVAEYAQTDFTNNKLNSGATPNTTRIPTGAFISEIVNSSQIRVATNAGAIIAGGTNSNAYIYFDMTQGYYDTSVAPIADDTITQDTAYPECGNISTLLQSYFADIASILSNGLTGNGVERRESSVNTDDLAVRSTVFTVNTGGGSSNPHLFETGTAVRLVPRAKTGTNPDKRLIRLPNGFSTNKKYYVIAPGRKTYPYDYSTGSFTRADATQLMLATSPENAAAGIYIYSPETDAIDNDVQIDLYQYVIDGKYDLHRYTCNVASAGIIETDVSHIFDNPGANSLPHAVFFRAATDIPGSALPQIAGGGTLDDQQVFYARYEKDTDSIAQKKFTIHTSFTDAVNNSANVSFTPGSGSNFYVFCDKRESPLRFDPTKGTTGSWYLNVEDESSGGSPRTDSILYRFHLSDYDDSSGKQRTNDTWYERLDDQREKEDRVYRLRYVIPEYLSTVRDPLNGFVIKLRTDETRRLVPQRLLLKPVGAAPSFCPLRNPAQNKSDEILGLKENEYSSITPTYDPYIDAVTVETESKLAFDVQSVRKKTVDGTEYAELTVIDHRVINQNLRGRLFYALKITEPQGGTFLSNTTLSNANNEVIWTGNCSGAGYIQSVITHVVDAQTTDYYMILKDVTGTLEYNAITDTTFSQQGGTVTTRLAAKPDSIGDPDGKSKSLRDDYLYAIPRAGVYTAIPGDRITVATDGGNVQYEISSVDDVEDFSDTFYVFDIDELQERIPGQQKGVYYLTCIRGNISPFPQGPGVGENFKNFKFSQPISQLYPLNYKNDPLWFQELDSSLVDPPETVSSADNYVHGLVTVNDYKNSETRESTLDLIENLGTGPLYTNTLVDSNSNTIDHRIRAQSGNATSGAEDRKIPIFGDQITPSASKLYVELRRPSIARSGNHTFEYLGFGPGNYSTGFPLRQEVVLTDKQDFYAQAKREDGGIVFYTGLNSNGDLYIGNKKVNAITGEETFLESAALVDSEDEDEDIGTLVTTFDSPVTFNSTITVAGKSTLNAPVEINVEANEGDALRVFSNIGAGDDPTLFNGSWRTQSDGDVVISKNQIKAAVFYLNARPKPGAQYGQSYTWRTNYLAGEPSNIVPWQETNYFYASQEVSYGGNDPEAGDIIYKGSSIGQSGSIGWILTNQFKSAESSVQTISADGTQNLTITWIATETNDSIGIKGNSTIRISNFSNPVANGTWEIVGWDDSTSPGQQTLKFRISTPIENGTVYNWADQNAGADLQFSVSNWKETGVLGAETLRTYTEQRGDFRLGINTVARAAHSVVLTANVDDFTTPRATLDVVGTTFISGKTLVEYNSAGDVDDNRYDDNNLNSDQREGLTGAPLLAQGFIPQDNALLVGGDSNDLEQRATLRVATTDAAVVDQGIGYQTGGRLGINTTLGLQARDELDRNLVVVGDGRITGNFLMEQDISVDGGDINTTSETFNLINNNANIINFAGDAQLIDMFSNTSNDQTITIGSNANFQTVRIGNNSGRSIFSVHALSANALVDIASVADDATNACQVFIGGAWANTDSKVVLGSSQTIAAGNVEIGSKVAAGTGVSRLFTQTGKARLFDDDRTQVIEAFTKANDITIASLGGSTTIRNSLKVQASATVDSNIILDGGTTAGIIEIVRSRFSTPLNLHNLGSLDVPNLDFYKYSTTGRFVDTEGNRFWGGSQDQAGGGRIGAFDNLQAAPDALRVSGQYTFRFADGGTGSGAAFDVGVAFDGTVTVELVAAGSGYADNQTLTIRDNQLGGGGAPDITFDINGVTDASEVFILPITTPAASDFDIGDLILLDRGNAASPDEVTPAGGTSVLNLRDQQYSEIMRVVGLDNLTNPNDPQGFRISVTRAQEGTGDPATGDGWTNHPDGCVIAKLDKQPAASYITGKDVGSFADPNVPDGILDEPRAGIDGTSANVRIGVAEFGGVLTTLDLLRIDQSEIVAIADVVSTDIQSLIVTDGGNPAVTNFKVESTTGNTVIAGNVGIGLGFNQFTIAGGSGNTNIAGTLTVEDTITLNGSTIPSTEFFTITNGGPSFEDDGVTVITPLRTTFQIDSATGNVVMNGGNINIFGVDGTTPRLTFNNSSGDFTTYGSFSALGDGMSSFGGPVTMAGDLTVNGGDLQVNQNGVEVFAVDDDGSVNIGGISNYFSSTGGRKWVVSNTNIINAEANVNYFVDVSGTSLLKLPANAQMGDMIRIIDIGGILSYDKSLVVRAPNLVRIQGSVSNTGTTVTGNTLGENFSLTHDGGELVVQTPNAAFGLVFAGTSDADGGPGANPNKAGWYLMDV